MLAFVVMSEGRKAGLERLAKATLGDRIEWRILLWGRTTEWFAGRLLPDGIGARPSSPEQAVAAVGPTHVHAPNLPEVARHAYRWTNQLLKELKERGTLDELTREKRAFMVEGQDALSAFYESLYGQKGGSHVG
jgi:hypothetical protein